MLRSGAGLILYRLCSVHRVDEVSDGPKSFTSRGWTMKSSVSNSLLTRGKTSGLFTVECEKWQHSWDVRSHDRMARWLSEL